MKSVTPYTFTLNAGQSLSLPVEGDYFRIQSATGAINVTVDDSGTLQGLLTGQGLKNTPFRRLTIFDASGAANTITILVAFEEFIDNRTYGVNDLSAGSLTTLRQPLAATGFYAANGALSANTAEQIFSPASNVNGAIVLTAEYDLDAQTVSGLPGAILSKTSAPTSIVDGEVLIFGQGRHGYTGSGYAIGYCGVLVMPQFIAPGRGLYVISAGAFSPRRACRFRLL